MRKYVSEACGHVWGILCGRISLSSLFLASSLSPLSPSLRFFFYFVPFGLIIHSLSPRSEHCHSPHIYWLDSAVISRWDNSILWVGRVQATTNLLAFLCGTALHRTALWRLSRSYWTRQVLQDNAFFAHLFSPHCSKIHCHSPFYSFFFAYLCRASSISLSFESLLLLHCLCHVLPCSIPTKLAFSFFNLYLCLSPSHPSSSPLWSPCFT